METTVFKRKGKNIGEWDGHTFRKRVKKSVHLFRVLDAWGIDAALMDKVLVPNKATIEIWDTEERKKYVISAEEAREKGEFYHFKQPVEDHGTQLFIRRSAFFLHES